MISGGAIPRSSMMNESKHNLVEGSIIGKLIHVALPIVFTQVFQMLYNLTDMFWLGRLSGETVAASGSVALYVWLSFAFILVGRMGAEIGVSQNLGRGDKDAAQRYGQNALMLAVILGVSVGVVFLSFSETLIGFFGIQENSVRHYAIDYLKIISFGMPFVFTTSAISGIFTGAGNSRTPLIVNGIGLAINMILDPVLIFTAGLGIYGAAVATVIAQFVTVVLAIYMLKKYKNRPFDNIKFFTRSQADLVKQIFKWVTPISLESLLFTTLTMAIMPLQAAFGADALATGRIGSQIESLTWLVGGGYAAALTSFTGQNFGAGKWGRIHKCFRISTVVMLCWGISVMLLMFFGGGVLFRFFIPKEPDVIALGVRYLRILAVIQIPQCLEGVAAGIFRGHGKTVPPSVSGISSNILRVLLAYASVAFTDLGLTGIWGTIALTAAVRGIWIYIWYLVYSRKLPNN